MQRPSRRLKPPERVLARLGPSIMQKAQQALRSRDMDLKDIDKRLQCLQRQMQEWQQKLRHQLPGEWAEI